MESDRSLAIFIDFENLALGFSGPRDRFDIGRVLERLVEKGKIVCKKAYADWSRFGIYTGPLHEAAIELIEIPRRSQTGKNSADIRLCVDAMDLAYSKEHINTFVIVSGDSDFSPLVSKLKELGKHVIGLGMQPSTSDLLRDNCDEFIYYEDLAPKDQLGFFLSSPLPESKKKLFTLLLESLLALRRENKEVLWSSMIKDTMKRKKPSFNESYYGYRTFSELLEDAQAAGVVDLETDPRSRTYKVARFGTEIQHPRPVAEPTELIKRKRRRRKPNGVPLPGPGTNGGHHPPISHAPQTPPQAAIHLTPIAVGPSAPVQPTQPPPPAPGGEAALPPKDQPAKETSPKDQPQKEPKAVQPLPADPIPANSMDSDLLDLTFPPRKKP